jgi:hypothetical protein
MTLIHAPDGRFKRFAILPLKRSALTVIRWT